MKRERLFGITVGSATLCVALGYGVIAHSKEPSRSAPESAHSPTTLTQRERAEPSMKVRGPRATPMLVKAAKARPTQAATRAPERFPERLDLATLSPRQRALVDRLEPADQALFAYKLEFLTRLRRCEGVDNAQGELSVFLNFRVDPNTADAEGNQVDLFDTDLAKEDLPRVLECVREAHLGFATSFEAQPPPGDALQWGTRLRFPLDRDEAYSLWAPAQDNADEDESSEESP